MKAEIVLTEEMLFVDVPLGPVCSGPLARTPELWRQKAIIPIDEVDIRVKQFRLGDMMPIHVRDLEPVDLLQRARRLGRAQIAAITERGRDIAVTR